MLVHQYIRAIVQRLSLALSVVRNAWNRLKMFLVDYLFQSTHNNAVPVPNSRRTAAAAAGPATKPAKSGSNRNRKGSKATTSTASTSTATTVNSSTAAAISMDSKHLREQQTRRIVINDGQHADNQLFRLKRGTVLHIVPGASLMGRRVAVYSNLPVNGECGLSDWECETDDDDDDCVDADRSIRSTLHSTDKADFLREQYLHVNWFNGSGKRVTSQEEPYADITNLDVYCELELNRAGAFHFYFTYQTEGDAKLSAMRRGSVYVQVEPTIRVGGGEELPRRTIALDAIRCQTVLTKCLGPLPTWEQKLLVAKQSGYNMVHFTPVQELGGSNSAYSIRDQRKVNPTFADPARPGLEPTFDDVERVIAKMRREWGIASICDIVLNHTANESKWIYEHPDASYSAATTPHLKPAILLDAMLAQVSADVAAGLLETVGVPAVIEYEDHIQALKYQIYTVYLPKVNVFEFYQLHVENYMKLFNDKVRSPQCSPRDGDYDSSNDVLLFFCVCVCFDCAVQIRNGSPPAVNSQGGKASDIVLVQDPLYRRLGCTIDFDAAYATFNVFR